MGLSSPPSEFDPKPIAPRPLLEGPLGALLEWQAMAEGAYSPNTLRAQKADGAIFQAFCEARGEPHLPAHPKTIRAFIEVRAAAGKKPANAAAVCGKDQHRPVRNGEGGGGKWTVYHPQLKSGLTDPRLFHAHPAAS